MTEPTIAEVVAGLSRSDRATLLGARAADPGEYWAMRRTTDIRLAGDDQVLTPLGLAVRASLQETHQ